MNHQAKAIEDSQEELVMPNITNPSSIYIKGTLKFTGYRKIELHCYVDTGASLCIASKHVILPEHWVDAERPIEVKIANGKTITINKVCKNLDMLIAEELFHIPTVYQQEAGIDFILGNNFCLTYSPFTQLDNRKIIFTLAGEEIWVKKITCAQRVGFEGYLESKKKNSKAKPVQPINISQNKIQILERGRDMLQKYREMNFIMTNLSLDIDRKSKIE